MVGNNVPLTFIYECKFVNNFGDFGAAISLFEGGGLYIANSQFYLEHSEYDYVETKEYFDQVIIDSMQEIYSQYDSRLAQSFLMSDSFFKDKVLAIKNKKG